MNSPGGGEGDAGEGEGVARVQTPATGRRKLLVLRTTWLSIYTQNIGSKEIWMGVGHGS